MLVMALILVEEGMYSVLRWKNVGNFELVWLILKSHAPVVSVLGGVIHFAQLFTTCVVYSVTNFKSNGTKNG